MDGELEADPNAEVLGKAWRQYEELLSRHGKVDLSEFLSEYPTSIHEEIREIVAFHNMAVQTPVNQQEALSHPLPPGSMIGQVEIIRSLGAGATGIVYLGTDIKLNRQVAVKILTSLENDVQQRAEIGALVRIDHPNIVKVFDTQDLDDGSVAVVMEFVESERGKACTLKEFLDYRRSLEGNLASNVALNDSAVACSNALPRPLTARTVAGWFEPVARGLASAHSKKVIHRDIKPGNLLLKAVGDNKFRLMIADWGFSKLPREDGEFSAMSQRIGTPHYQAPECSLPDLLAHLDRRCDVFSFGITLFETLALIRPMIESSERPPPKTNLDRDFDIICGLCLEWDPRNRISSLEQIADELGRLHRGEPILLGPTSNLRRHWTKLTRWRIWSYSAPFLATCIVILAVLALRIFRQQATQKSVDRASLASAASLMTERPQVAALKAALAHDVARDVDSHAAALALARFNWSRRSCPSTLHAMSWPEVEVDRIRLDPAGGWLAARSRNGQWRLWNLESEDEQDLGGLSPMTAFASSPDGRKAFGFETGAIVIQSNSGIELAKLGLSSAPRSIAFHPSANRVAIAHRELIEWDGTTDTSTKLAEIGTRIVDHLEYSPDGTRLLTRDTTGMVQLSPVGKVSSQSITPLHHRSDLLLDTHFLPNGRQLVVANADSEVTVHDALSGKIIAKLAAPGRIQSMTIGLQTGEISVGGFRWTMRWPDISRPGITVNNGQDHDVTSLAWTPDERVLLSACANGTLRGWSPREQAPTDLLLELNRVTLVASDPRGHYFATLQHGSLIRVWAQPFPSRDFVHFAGPTFVAVSDDGRYFLPDGSHRLGQSPSKIRVRTVEPSASELSEIPLSGSIRGAAFRRPTGREILLLTHNPNQVEFRDFVSGDPLSEPISLDAAPLDAAYSPDGSIVVVVTDQGNIVVLDTETRTIRDRLDQGGSPLPKMFLPHAWLAFSPDGSRFATWGLSERVTVWRSADATQESLLAHVDTTAHAEFSRDGRYLATATFGYKDKKTSNATIWDLKENRESSRFSHPDWVFSVHFSNDGRYLLTACKDHKARLWSIRDGRVVQTFEHSDEVFDARLISPEGHYSASRDLQTDLVVTASKDFSLGIWDATTGERIAAPLRTGDWPLQIEATDPNGTLLIGGQGPVVQLVQLTSEDDIRPEHLTEAKLTQLAQALIDHDSVIRLNQQATVDSDFVANWHQLRKPLRIVLRELSSPQRLERWHQKMATISVNDQDWNAALFHMGFTTDSTTKQTLVATLRSRIGSRDQVESWRILANEASQKQNRITAESLLQKVFDYGSPTAADFDLRSHLLLYRQKFSDALADCDRAIALGSGVHSRVRRTRLLTYLDQWDLALQELDLLVQQFPDAEWPRWERAEVNGYMKRFHECRLDFQQLVEQFGNHGHGRMGYAIACAAAEDSNAFIQAARVYYQANRSQVDPHQILGCAVVYALCEKMPIEDQNQILTLFQKVWRPDDYYSQLIPGEILFRVGRFDEAATYLEEAVRRQRQGGTPFELSFLAMCRLKQGQIETAQNLLVEAQIAFDRMSGSHRRALLETDVRTSEIGVAMAWYHIEMYRLVLKEAERRVAAANEM